MELAKLSVVELKALVFDQLAQIEVCQNNVRILNEEMNKRKSVNVEKEEDVRLVKKHSKK